jgi:hypothetical protein
MSTKVPRKLPEFMLTISQNDFPQGHLLIILPENRGNPQLGQKDRSSNKHIKALSAVAVYVTTQHTHLVYAPNIQHLLKKENNASKTISAQDVLVIDTLPTSVEAH